MATPLATPMAHSEPLAFMRALSPTVAYWDPGQQQLHQPPRQQPPPSSQTAPDLIIVLSWMAARDEHIVKYVAQHRVLFPSSPILLIRCPLLRVWLPWMARRDMKPALPLLRALVKGADGLDDERARPRVLVHMFSNGGISSAVHLGPMLLEAGLRRGNDAMPTLPRYVLLLDSCPGYFRWRNTHRALVQTLPWWASPLMHVVIAAACVFHALRRLPPAQNQNAHAVCAPPLVSHECRRTYLYGTADEMVNFRDVEDNARKAETKGFSVRRERFQGARHVALAKAEPTRYWQAVRESWDGAGSWSQSPKARDP